MTSRTEWSCVLSERKSRIAGELVVDERAVVTRMCGPPKASTGVARRTAIARMRPLSMIIATLLSLHAFCTLSAPSDSKGGLTLVFIYLYSHLYLRTITAKCLRFSLGSLLWSDVFTMV